MSFAMAQAQRAVREAEAWRTTVLRQARQPGLNPRQALVLGEVSRNAELAVQRAQEKLQRLERRVERQRDHDPKSHLPMGYLPRG
jgi:hypothetical protein